MTKFFKDGALSITGWTIKADVMLHAVIESAGVAG